MNELQYIREQVRTERRHMAEVRLALTSALDAGFVAPILLPFCAAGARYLVFIVKRFNAQDQLHCDQLQPHLAPEDVENRESLQQLTQTLARSREAIGKLDLALRSCATGTAEETLRSACSSYLAFYRDELATRRNSLYPLLERHYGVAEWRRASLVDAESILEERALYGAVQASLPEGIELKSGGRPASPNDAVARRDAAP